MLSGRLKGARDPGLVLRQVEPGPPVRVSYELTERPLVRRDVAQAIERWGRACVPRNVSLASRAGARRPCELAGRLVAREPDRRTVVLDSELLEGPADRRHTVVLLPRRNFLRHRPARVPQRFFAHGIDDDDAV